MSPARKQKQYQREFILQKIGNNKKILFQKYGKQIVNILKNQKRNDSVWLTMEEASPDIGISYVTTKHLEIIQSLYRTSFRPHVCKQL